MEVHSSGTAAYHPCCIHFEGEGLGSGESVDKGFVDRSQCEGIQCVAEVQPAVEGTVGMVVVTS